MKNQELNNRFEFRNIKPEEIEEAIRIEQICFPPHEACKPESMRARVQVAADLFLVAIDKETGKIAGFFNGIATDEEKFRDEFFTDAGLHNPKGKTVMLIGLDVLPEYRGLGLATGIVSEYIRREQARGRQLLILTCLEDKLQMYEKMGYQNHGKANSCWGGEVWYEMGYRL